MSSARRKALGAGLALAVLIGLSIGQAVGVVSVARVLLGLTVVVGVGYAAWRGRPRRGLLSTNPAPRLEVVARSGLSSRCGVALVEVDGSPYLIAFGDSFAQVQPTDVAPPPMFPFSRPAGMLQ